MFCLSKLGTVYQLSTISTAAYDLGGTTRAVYLKVERLKHHPSQFVRRWKTPIVSLSFVYS